MSILRCAAWKTHRGSLLAIVQEHQEVDHDNSAASLLSFACRKYKVLSVNSYICGMQYLTEALLLI